MRAIRTLGWTLILAAASGCVADSASTSSSASSTGPPPAPEPTVGAETGSITGHVLTDEASPIPGADLGLLELSLERQADEDGAFTFNEVPPGKYTLVAQQLGFDSVSRRIDVVAGEITKAEFQLKALEVASDAYAYTLHRTGYITFGQWTVQYAQHLINQSAANDQMCSPCAWNLPLVKNIKAAMTEVDFTPSVSLPPVVNYQIGIGIIKDYVQGSTSPSNYLSITYYSPRTSYHWINQTVNELKGETDIRLQLHGPGPGAPGVALQQRVEIYVSFSVNGDFAEGFTALPPT